MAGEKPNWVCAHQLCQPRLSWTHEGCFSWMVADGLCPWPLFQGAVGSASPLELLPRAALLPLFQSHCNTNPRGAGGNLWDKQALSSSFREWKPLCLGSKCGGTRLINLAASHEECQCLLVRPQRSFCSTQRGLLHLDGLGALD